MPKILKSLLLLIPKNQLKKHPWTTIAGLAVLLMVGIDVIRHGIHAETAALAMVAVGLLKASDSKEGGKTDA